jgi:hypothetical protein
MKESVIKMHSKDNFLEWPILWEPTGIRMEGLSIHEKSALGYPVFRPGIEPIISPEYIRNSSSTLAYEIMEYPHHGCFMAHQNVI